MSLVPDSLACKFQESGWYPDRQVEVDGRVPADHPARAVLSEFGGLRLMRFYGDYEVCEIEFRYLADKDDFPRRWEAVLGTELVGIAEHHNAHGELWMSSQGHLFGNGMVAPAFWHVGSTFQESIENLMAGHPGRPMLLDTQASVRHFGREYTRNDPEVLRPTSPELRH
jgi:SUKH-3 immunity protein